MQVIGDVVHAMDVIETSNSQLTSLTLQWVFRKLLYQQSGIVITLDSILLELARLAQDGRNTRNTIGLEESEFKRLKQQGRE
jgi:hypothetical protein